MLAYLINSLSENLHLAPVMAELVIQITLSALLWHVNKLNIWWSILWCKGESRRLKKKKKKKKKTGQNLNITCNAQYWTLF